MNVENERPKRKRGRRAQWSASPPAAAPSHDVVNAHVAEIKRGLGASLRTLREACEMTQTELADRMGSSQSRVAKMESGDSTVSVDLLVLGLLKVGATRQEIGLAFLGKIPTAAMKRIARKGSA
jgi:ribosome-binding protein aMBF1 (putative translation factor)